MRKGSALFLSGGIVYVLIELAFRQHSHISMFFAGGTCLLLIHAICNGMQKKRPILLRCVTGSVLITAVEFAFGLLFNRDLSVWNYSALPLNFQGQICLPFSAAWALLTFPAMKLGNWVENGLENRKKRKNFSV